VKKHISHRIILKFSFLVEIFLGQIFLQEE